VTKKILQVVFLLLTPLISAGLYNLFFDVANNKNYFNVVSFYWNLPFLIWLYAPFGIISFFLLSFVYTKARKELLRATFFSSIIFILVSVFSLISAAILGMDTPRYWWLLEHARNIGLYILFSFFIYTPLLIGMVVFSFICLYKTDIPKN
jgi:hypothetical protein